MRFLVVVFALLAAPACAESPQIGEIPAREMQAIISERSRAIEQRFELEKDAVRQRFEGQEKAVAAALAAAKEAVGKAESAAEKRFDSVNEFRSTLKDQQATLMPRTEVDVRFKGLESKLADLDGRVVQIVARAEGSAQLWQGITVVLGICLTSAMAFMAFRRRAV